ncbi:hypothetical protein PYW07_014786 [Mythimna separata]|uniref:Small RNA 2'-O-methyltransferase n=1 Tax=Mythimna separata TaxID=271217 RepID=A0AAD7Z0E8_MYTSE|nr:hypothetical protein PYW07_014786 [Mythimna separata]
MIVTLQTLVFFRESLFNAVDRFVRPYYKQLTLGLFAGNGSDLDDEEVDDQVFSEYDDEKGVTFYPPMYAQRYAAVSDCLLDDRWAGKIEKVVDFGHHDMSFIKYLKDVPGIHSILGVDIETIPLRCSSDLLGDDEYSPKRESPMKVTLFQGNAADPDYRLIGCDAVIAIEMIEHMLPHDLERFVHTVFGFIKPRIVIFTTPNSDFNVLFKALEKNGLRRLDHLFEWSREQFHDWCSNIVARYPNYTVTCKGIGPGPPGTLHLGCCSQLALFTAKEYHKQADLNLNCLASQLVCNGQNRNHISEIFDGCWESSATPSPPPLGLECPSPPPKLDQAENGGHVWCNINWGDNAPYWNQYYKVVKEYAYPFETKSEEVRILDQVSEEINRLIDTKYDDESSVDVNRMEIPLAHLMNVVRHITDDVDRVRDLLEWNGYEIVDDVVIHSRLVVDASSVATHEDEWQENFSDWDTAELRTPSVSDGSTTVPDVPGRCLRRALDQKVRNLRKMLAVDADITTELDKVVCRLMKLALHSSMGREAAPPSRWMQCKLLDLLTLTEKAISRRKMNFIQSVPLKPDKQLEAVLEQDTRVKQLVEKYRYLIQPDKMTNTDDNNDRITDVDLEDEFLSTTSNEFSKENDYTVGMSPSLVIPQPIFSTEAFETADTNTNPLERTEAWLAEDLEVEPYPTREINYEDTNSDDSASNMRHKHKISIKKEKTSNKNIRDSVADQEKASNNNILESVIDPSKTISKTSCKYKIKREFNNKKHNKTQKVARKKSSCKNVVENPIDQYSSIVYDNYVLGSKRSDHGPQTLNVAAAKPIPGSLIALCNPNLKTGDGKELLCITNDADRTNPVSVPSCVSATEVTLRSDIIVQDCEETMALRRTIGTDLTIEPELERQLNVRNSSHDFDKSLCTKHEVSTENVQSQTIFLNDINEPSTSKGIRHNISTDVQCGPDTLAACPLLTPVTSVTKMPQVFSTGIKINDVTVDSKIKGTDFGTSTQETDGFKTITPRWGSVGITIKDSDTHLGSKAECSTMTIPEYVLPAFATNTSSAVCSAMSFNGTKLLKPISSNLKAEDSGSEFCIPSIASTSKMCEYYMTESKPTSNLLIKSFETKEVESYRSMESPSKILKLTCGAVHVHSYRDKEVSEDVVYQGEWQRYKPKTNNARKKTFNYSTLRKSNVAVINKSKEKLKEKKVNSKEKIYRKRQEKKPTDAESNKLTQMRNVKLRKVSQQDKSSEDKKPRISKSKSTVKISTKTKSIPRPTKTTTKVPTKQAISANNTKNAKSTFTINKTAILATIFDKKEDEKSQKPKKSHIPLYLKKNLHKDTLNKSLDSASKAMTGSMDKLANEIVPLMRSSTEEIRKDLLTFSEDLRVNISYVVCRNDIEDKMISSDEQTSGNSKDKVTPKQKDVLKRSYSPSYSINSSTCSSPNSVATVRAASTRNKIAAKRYSAQSYKSNNTNSESDNASPSKKKVIKRPKAVKKTDIKDIGNKENIPESTKNFAIKDKPTKSPFRPKSASAYIVQLDTECSISPAARQKTQISNKSIVKRPSRKDSDEKRRASTPSVSKKKSPKSDTSLKYEYDDNFIEKECESFRTLDSGNMVLVLEQQPNYVDTSIRNISRKSSSGLAFKSNHNLMDELVHESSLLNNASEILDAMRQILEETLDRIIVSHENNNHSNLSFRTVVLTTDDSQKALVDKIISDVVPEIKTTGIGLVETSQSDIKNTLNRNFDVVLGDESTLNFNDNSLTITDLDLLSFKSVTSDSKYSEYYLADNEFNTSQEIDQGQTQNNTSVQDLFERKEPQLNQTKLQTIPGALAIQAFSGFSLDAEPVAGDQPDTLPIIDSETDSLAVEINRLATSEELFISGRSSESYASFVLDEDAVVPNWLFQLISQQHAVEENREPLIGPEAAPRDEPLYDGNGNVVEPSLLGMGAGAGDGRGMHSDHSQDSSGRGTSLSSSETSSGLHSEVSTVLVDPSGQFELHRDPMTSSSVMPMIDFHSTSTRLYGNEDDSGLVSSRTRTINTASDIDADISSIETDAPDFSDN